MRRCQVPGEHDATDDESGREPHPEAAHAVAKREAERVGDGQADEPVAGQVDHHRHPRAAQSAQGAGGHGLESVEELEHGGHEQQRGAQGHDVRARGEEPDERAWYHEKGEGGRAHEARAEQDRHPAGPRRPLWIAGADAVADPHGAGRRHAEWHHERRAGDVERDLMRGARHRIETSGKRRGQAEHTHFERDLRGGGEAEPPQTHEALARQATRDIRESRRARAVDPTRGEPQHAEHVDARDARRPRGAGHAERRQAQLTVDERPVGGGIQQVGGDEREGDWGDDVHPLQVAADRGVEQQRQRAPDHDPEIAMQEGHHLGVEAHMRNRRQHAQQDAHDRDGETRAHGESMHQPAMAIAVVAGTVGL